MANDRKGNIGILGWLLMLLFVGILIFGIYRLATGNDSEISTDVQDTVTTNEVMQEEPIEVAANFTEIGDWGVKIPESAINTTEGFTQQVSADGKSLTVRNQNMIDADCGQLTIIRGMPDDLTPGGEGSTFEQDFNGHIADPHNNPAYQFNKRVGDYIYTHTAYVAENCQTGPTHDADIQTLEAILNQMVEA